MAKAKKSATLASKKVGTSRVTRRSRTIQVGTAKHTYKTVAAAKTAYTRLRSAKAVNGFKAKYGKTAKKAAPKRRRAVRKTVRKTVRRTTRKAAPKRRTTKRRVARKNPVRRTKRRVARRRNAPVSRAEAGSVRSILRRHGYIA